ncbi:general secretion pathway protein GspE [Planctopirus hydrillae]|uniref:General secretion pathway protein GspE n=1 Tax=Planctopirus hydrillae TaxID=1841610 RepID=A0A1C3E9W6_9PLAN|nr:general secretion pathway protein GspE [Planctopirus hydrillae]ODA30031.1 general secretion pathway protein GspE [Planctopirus hydrillae]
MAIDVYKEWLGIPEGDRPPDHYALLRVIQFEDDPDKIRKNYKKLNGHVRKYATGQYATESQELLNELARAMLCLTDLERKLDYDRSLGREIDDRDPSTGRRPVTAYLVDQGVISQDQAKEVKAFADRSGLTLKDAVVQLKLADGETAARALASELGRPFVDLNEMLPDDSILDLLPRQVVRRHTCLPLFEDDGQILVACADDPTQELEDEIRLRYDKPMRHVIASQLGINQGISKYYANGMRKEVAEPNRKKGSKSSASKPGAAAPRKQAAEKLTDDEYTEQRNMGILIICGTLIAGFNLDTWILWPYVYQNRIPGWVFFPLTFLVAPPVIFFAYMNYIKRK